MSNKKKKEQKEEGNNNILTTKNNKRKAWEGQRYDSKNISILTWRNIRSNGWRAFGRQKPGMTTGPPCKNIEMDINTQMSHPSTNQKKKS